jgi:hypothetical protein
MDVLADSGILLRLLETGDPLHSYPGITPIDPSSVMALPLVTE